MRTILVARSTNSRIPHVRNATKPPRAWDFCSAFGNRVFQQNRPVAACRALVKQTFADISVRQKRPLKHESFSAYPLLFRLILFCCFGLRRVEKMLDQRTQLGRLRGLERDRIPERARFGNALGR